MSEIQGATSRPQKHQKSREAAPKSSQNEKVPPVHNPSQKSGSSARPGGMREPSLETLVSLIRLHKATETKSNTALRPQGARRISSLRAFRRAMAGEAKGRVDWKRIRWPDAKFEVTGATCDLGREPYEGRGNRAEKREKKEARKEKQARPKVLNNSNSTDRV